MRNKNFLLIFSLILIFLLLLIAYNSTDTDQTYTSLTFRRSLEEIPNLKIAYILTNHQTPLMLAISKQEGLSSRRIYLKEVIEKKKYKLMEGNKPRANIDLVAAKSSSEIMTLMAQDQIDLSLASSTAFIRARDQGNPVKILSPLHTEGIRLVIGKDLEINDWEDFLSQVKTCDKSISIGYPSPTSASLILLESVLNEENIKYTKDPLERDADILLVDLEDTSNFIPINNRQVDAWVGPSPYPELARLEDPARKILDMKDLPPRGKWNDFPCCAIGAREDTIKKHPKEIEQLLELITIAANYCEDNREETAEINSKITGLSLEAAKLSTIKYTTDPSLAWVDNMDLTYQTLRYTNSLTQDLANKTFREAREELFDFTFIEKVLK